MTECRLILDYIDVLAPEPKLLPRDGSDCWRTLAEMGQAMGLLEGITVWLRTLLLPETEHTASITSSITSQSLRVNRAADALEGAIARGAYAGQPNTAQIVLGTALGRGAFKEVQIAIARRKRVNHTPACLPKYLVQFSFHPTSSSGRISIEAS